MSSSTGGDDFVFCVYDPILLNIYKQLYGCIKIQVVFAYFCIKERAGPVFVSIFFPLPYFLKLSLL